MMTIQPAVGVVHSFDEPADVGPETPDVRAQFLFPTSESGVMNAAGDHAPGFPILPKEATQ